ncbi:hypothetical protein BCV69DRAFT_141406 [Microstroma glucosiphilum]|uniref:Uncharacterized protein n=1 Tax=Pseudomicrostroma glucosiphilum TaxID=1684307 RepID=A0A316UAV5_9BASI|nr:hypothetical protein BCV69DRAFT_141406 [Pseudomicrostroma glucosiphilum]PWN22346.1 hypothetical protein BCV69DRAFT_141406 [Pseudomicrostroma glucosiphilum]
MPYFFPPLSPSPSPSPSPSCIFMDPQTGSCFLPFLFLFLFSPPFRTYIPALSLSLNLSLKLFCIAGLPIHPLQFLPSA